MLCGGNGGCGDCASDLRSVLELRCSSNGVVDGSGWSKLPSLPCRVSDAACARTNGNCIYVVGGVQSGQPSDRIWRLRRLPDQDVSTFSWVSAGSRLPHGARYSSSAVVVGCILYVIGGNTESGSPCCDLYSYNMKSGLWTTLTPMTHARAGFCAVAVVESSSILVCGGF